MWLRAVAVALAAGCWAVGAQAGQYAEVWNPPETRQAPKNVKTHAPVGKKPAAKGAVKAGKNKPHKLVAKKATLHAAHKSTPHAAHKTAAAHAEHPVKTHNRIAAKGESKKPLRMAQSTGAHEHAGVHQNGQKVAAGHAVAHAGSSVASASVKPAAAPVMTHAAPLPAASAQLAPAMASTSAKPAANGGNLPPILH